MDHYISSLEVILSRHAEQNNPLIRHELPNSFDVVTKLPPRPRDQADDEDAIAAEDPHPHRSPVMAPDHASRARPTAPQSVGASGQGQRSSGDSREPSSEPPTVPAVNSRIPSPMEVAIPSCQAVTAAVEEGATDGRDPVLQEANPSRGPTTGGLRIWIEGSDIPTGLEPLYARFGDNFVRVVGTLFDSFDHHLIEPRLFETLF